MKIKLVILFCFTPLILWCQNQHDFTIQKEIAHYNVEIKKGDLSLFHVLTDANIVFSNDFHPSLFYGFLKVINPQDSFSIQVTFSGEEPEKKIVDIFNYLEKHLVLVTNENLKKQVGLPNIERLNQAVLYKNNFIALPTELIDLKNDEK